MSILIRHADIPKYGHRIAILSDGHAYYEDFINPYVDLGEVVLVANAPTIIQAEEKGGNFCADCHWYEAEEQYCFRNGCHSYDESSCEFWEPMPADEPIPAPGG